jgi:hypothetical protein
MNFFRKFHVEIDGVRQLSDSSDIRSCGLDRATYDRDTCPPALKLAEKGKEVKMDR